MKGGRRVQKGFSLVEMLVALVILSVSILAMTSLSITLLKSNTKNELRNATVRLSKEVAADILAGPFVGLSDGSTSRTITVHGMDKTFSVVYNVTDTSANLKEVAITVQTNFGSDTFSNEVVVYKNSSE